MVQTKNLSMRYLFFIYIIISSSLVAQENKGVRYQLLDIHKMSDFNYQGIDSLDHSSKAGIWLLDHVFNVVDGDYTVYRFINHDRGVLFDDSDTMDIYNLIILKTDENNLIIDGFHYSLTNPEMPLTCKLYRITHQQKMSKNIDIRALLFKRKQFLINKEDDICDSTDLFFDAEIILDWNIFEF